MSVTEYRAPSGKRSVSTSSSPHSYTIVCPSQDRSVDVSPAPAAANTYAARHRADALWHSSDRSDAFVTVIGEPERFADHRDEGVRTVAAVPERVRTVPGCVRVRGCRRGRVLDRPVVGWADDGVRVRRAARPDRALP